MVRGLQHPFFARAIFAAAVVFTQIEAVCAEPRAGAGAWELVGTYGLLLRDPFTGQPVSLLNESHHWLSPGGNGVLDGEWEIGTSGLGVLTVQDVSPEFWAQPSVWKMFQRGPSLFSGFNKDAGPREWAGRPALDRRAYDLDPGWQTDTEFTPPPTPGVGPIKIKVIPGSLELYWHALPGRVYVIEFTPSLVQPFQVVQTLSSLMDGETSLELPIGSANGFYRIGEQVY